MQQLFRAQRGSAPADADGSTRQRILAATAEVLARNGTTKLSLSEVAAEAGISRPTLYRRFASKKELLHAFTRWERHLFESGLAEASLGLSAKDRIDAAVRFVVAYQQSYSECRMVDIEPEQVIERLAQVIPVMRERLNDCCPGRVVRRPQRPPSLPGIALPDP